MAKAPTVVSSVQSDIDELGDLTGIEPTLAAAALRLAKEIDSDEADGRTLPGLVKELRMILKQLTEGRSGGDDDDDSDLGSAS